jgi:hypothetical protein
MDGVPRPFEIMSKESKDSPAPIGQQPISSREQAQRLGPLMGLIASGDVPLDATAAKAIQTYIDEVSKRER